ncbi:hypothetical protein DL93DRAFT_2170759 [Clavulina sp. PMI_390]|nr:hypothetical protein DL93DRAFT_2170759 [Clavulina sp. PMI_390]
MSSAATILGRETTVERLDVAMELMSGKGRGPNPTDPAERQAWIMSNGHGCIVNMLKQFYILGPNIKKADYDDFVKYGLMWCSIVHAHHHEEEWWFPYLSEAIDVESVGKEHELFYRPLMEMEGYLISCLPAGTEWGVTRNKVPSDTPNATFDFAKVNTLINTLVVSLLPHLCDEISYLDGSKLRALVSKENWTALEKRSQKEWNSLPIAFLVAGVIHAPNPSFPPAPWFVTKILVPGVFSWKYRRIWRFAPAVTHWT